MFDLIDGCMISWRPHGVCGAAILFGAVTLDKLVRWRRVRLAWVVLWSSWKRDFLMRLVTRV